MKKQLLTTLPFTLKATAGTFEEYEYTPNGLRIIYAPIPDCNAVVTNIVYLAGSRHELPGKTGIAHMLEHMMFKDTLDTEGKRVTIPRYKQLEKKGALLNANTWTDRTCYYFVMPPEYLGDMLLAEAERMRGLILTDKAFTPEQKNVLSEYEMYASRPDFILSTAISTHAFVSHGYGHETIGFKSDIENLTCSDLKEFYDNYYWPNNAYLVVAGDVAKEDVFRLVDTHFAHIAASPKPVPVPLPIEPARTFQQTIRLERKNPLTLTTLCYSAPQITDTEWVTGTIALMYLSSGKISPLYKKLVEAHKASSVHGSMTPFHDPGTITIDISVAQGSTAEDIHAIVLKEIACLRTSPISEKDLTRIKNKVIADTLYARDGVEAVAHELTEYIAGGDWKKYTTTVSDIQEVTPAAIQAFAQKWLSPETVLIGTLKGTV